MYRGEFRSGKNHHIRAKNVHPAARRMSEGLRGDVAVVTDLISCCIRAYIQGK